MLVWNAQTRLLRVSASRANHTTVGGRTRDQATDVRIVAATNKDSSRILINQGLFREDLFYRLNVVPLEAPRSLRDRA